MMNSNSETLLVDGLSYRLESFANSMLLRSKQRKVYTELLNKTQGLDVLLQSASPQGRAAIIEGISDHFNILQFHTTHEVVDAALMDLQEDPTLEGVQRLQKIISLISPNQIEHVKLLRTYSNTLASENIIKALQSYTPSLD